FALHKEGGRDLSQSLVLQPQAGLSQAHFPLGTVSRSHGGRERPGDSQVRTRWAGSPHPPSLSLGHLPDTPSLSVQPGPRVASGENVTLLCHSQSPRNTFLLCKEGEASPPLRLISKYRTGNYQAEFSISPVTSAHGGTYRCYSSNGTSPFLLSLPSEPLVLLVSASHSQDYTLENSIRMGVAGLVLVVLGVLLFWSRNSQKKTQHAART
ncbi:PREDICTED: leukocyte immunoglobulin-like receptor subfamily A member 6, partial [Myotis davidii]|uniref:leukocyte immunoglobulin-like receptor subfamily A member 6 n=1 Tax=Myotis davidii TaxID=225400 RepID=UPI0007677AF7